MGKLIEKDIDGVLTPVDQDDWKADKQAVIDEVRKNRETMKLGGPDTNAEARDLVAENELPDEEEEGDRGLPLH